MTGPPNKGVGSTHYKKHTTLIAVAGKTKPGLATTADDLTATGLPAAKTGAG
jgi:hypothetical protein